jgi:hypothetical protein
MRYLNRYRIKNTFRYKQIRTNDLKYIKTVHSSRILKYWNYSETVNGVNYHYVPFNYYPQWFYRFLWSLSLLRLFKYKKPANGLDKQSMRHITIVVLMILAIAVSLFVAYMQGAFN